uniref:Thioredoxin domain-containing protein 17 n=1 Tax=Elaeophora elaphi TaxID=1147741 RepID=A0A0R3RUL1_9BILA
MSLDRRKVEGFDELNELLKDIKCRAVILFSGSKENGQSWCPDCVQAEPIIEKVIEEIVSSGDIDENFAFVECGVGLRTYYDNFSWKDLTNAFRVDERFKVKEIPTLLDYSNKVKLFPFFKK